MSLAKLTWSSTYFARDRKYSWFHEHSKNRIYFLRVYTHTPKSAWKLHCMEERVLNLFQSPFDTRVWYVRFVSEVEVEHSFVHLRIYNNTFFRCSYDLLSSIFQTNQNKQNVAEIFLLSFTWSDRLSTRKQVDREVKSIDVHGFYIWILAGNTKFFWKSSYLSLMYVYCKSLLHAAWELMS